MSEEKPADALAVVIGSGGIGSALADRLDRSGDWQAVWRTGRSSDPAVDLRDEATVSALAERITASGMPLRLVIIASGFLHDDRHMPEKSWRQLDPDHMAKAFAVNAIGPALVMKHLLPLLPREGRSVLAALSARVGSIGDNRLGGWTSYRASKAALNQVVRTQAIELRRRRPEAICVALHPGTVATGLSAPFSKDGLDVREPDQAAAELLSVIGNLEASDSGSFRDHRGDVVPW